jgi:hypothetical protein
MYDTELIKKGVFKNDNFEINYNGFNGWLSTELYLKIQSKKTIDISDIGLSFREYYLKNVEYTNIQKTIDYVNSLNIKNKKLITTKNIDKTLFNDDIVVVEYTNDFNDSKLNHVISHIIGYKIENSAFVPISIDKYINTHYYDPDGDMTTKFNNINDNIYLYLENTIGWLKDKIKLYIKMNDVNLFSHELTTNKINPFVTKKIKILTGD